MTRYFILGGGIAGLEAAKAIRQNDPQGLIVLLGGEKDLPYTRPMVTKQLMAGVSAAELAVKSPGWYDAPGRDIVALTGRTVDAIDTVKKTVTLTDGNVFSYDKLVYALGARCFVPPFEGSSRENVIPLRTMEDAARVRTLARNARSAAVIGGGVLGLEAAWSLRQSGLDVSVIEFEGRIMPRQIDDEAARHLTDAIARHGVKLLTGASAARLDDNGLILTDGRMVAADLVVVSAGIRANTGVAAQAGIRTDRHVIVDERMQTSAPDVYAAGDCASCGVSYGLWAEASEMGRVAGVNAAGGQAAYKAVPRPLIFHGFGTELFAIGDVGRSREKTYEVGEMPGARYYFLDGKPVGAILTGDISRAEEARRLIVENA